MAIVAEYNPLHNGHEYQIDTAKRLLHADYIIVLMTGNYNQRGMPAFVSKRERAKYAIAAGVDLILELPVLFSLEDIPEFAFAAASIIDQLAIVDNLLFSSESGDLGLLNQIADIINTKEFARLMQQNQNIVSSSKRRATCLSLMGHPDFIKKINQPNNLFGIYFIASLKRLDSATKPITINRIGDDYFDTGEGALVNGKRFCSATAVRELLTSVEPADTLPEILKEQVPYYVYKRMESLWKKSFPIERKDFWPVIQSKLNTHSIDELSSISGMTNERAEWMKTEVMQATNYEQYIACLQKYNEYLNFHRLVFRIVIGCKVGLLNESLGNGVATAVNCLEISAKGEQLIDVIEEKSKMALYQEYYVGSDEYAATQNKIMLEADSIYYGIANKKYEEKIHF